MAARQVVAIPHIICLCGRTYVLHTRTCRSQGRVFQFLCWPAIRQGFARHFLRRVGRSGVRRRADERSIIERSLPSLPPSEISDVLSDTVAVRTKMTDICIGKRARHICPEGSGKASRHRRRRDRRISKFVDLDDSSATTNPIGITLSTGSMIVPTSERSAASTPDPSNR
jgi:hypothetical protein